MKLSIKDFFSKCDQIRNFLWIWSYLLKKYLMENFILCVDYVLLQQLILQARSLQHCQIFTNKTGNLKSS